MAANSSSSYKWPYRCYMWKIKLSLLLFLLKKSNQKSSPLQRRLSSRTPVRARMGKLQLKKWQPALKTGLQVPSLNVGLPHSIPWWGFRSVIHPFIPLFICIGPGAIPGLCISCLILCSNIKGWSRNGFFSPRADAEGARYSWHEWDSSGSISMEIAWVV